MLIQVLNKPKILLYLTSLQQNLSNQISKIFMKCNSKTHMHINKFAKKKKKKKKPSLLTIGIIQY